MLRLVQLVHPSIGRRIAIVEEPRLRLLDFSSLYDAAGSAIAQNRKLAQVLSARSTSESLDYDAVYQGRSLWKLLPAFDHPTESARCSIMGTGLTHKASAQMRQSMHGKPADVTDSMKMYQIV